MDIVELLGTRFLRPLFAVVLLVGLSAAAARPQDQAAQTQGKQDQNQEQAEKNVPPQQVTPSQPKEEVKITPREAEELFHSVDEILAFDSKRTGLPIKKQVKRRLTSRDEVVGYQTRHMKDEDV